MRTLLESLRSRLLMGSLTPLVLFLSTAIVSYLTIQRLIGVESQVQRSYAVLAKAYTVKANIAMVEATKRGHHLVEEDGQEEARRLYDRGWVALTDELDSLQQLVEEDRLQKSQVQAARSIIRSWGGLAEIDFAFYSKKKTPLLPPEVQEGLGRISLHEMMRLTLRVIESIDAIIDIEKERLAELNQQTARTTRESVWAIGLTLLTATLLSIFIPLQLARTVARPLERLTEAAHQLRQGTFTTVPPTGPREIGRLTRYFNMLGLALTEREALLRTAERRYQGLLGSSHSLMWTLDSHGAFSPENNSWLTFTGQGEEEVRGEGWLEAVHPEDRPRMLRRWREAVRGKISFREECRIRRHDRTYRTFSCQGVPILGSHRNVIEWVCACTDITERKEEERLRQQMKAAEAASLAKSQFLTRMSHELRTPLNAIIGMSKMLSTCRFGALNDKQADYLTDITRAGEHLLGLINDVLDLSKVEAGHLQLHPQKIGLSSTVNELLSTLHTLAESRRQTLTYQPPVRPGEITTDPGRFKQILFNLVSNAIKFTPEEGTITVRAAWVGSIAQEAGSAAVKDVPGVRVDVEDTGIGIPLEDQNAIWSEFHQASNNQKSIEGTGLGLALTRRLVTLLGGRIWLRSEPGQGSCFSFVLPLAPSFQATPVASLPSPGQREEPSPVAPQQPLALIIEDHEPTNKLLSDWLHDVEVRTSSAFTGPEGLEQARRLRPQLILLDLRLPHMDGWEVLTELKSDPATSSIPVIVVSSLDEGHLPGNVDVLDWLVKPFDREQMLQRLQTVCPALLPQGHRVALVVEDDAASRKLLADLLRGEGIDPIAVEGGEMALRVLAEKRPDLVVLDLMMPGVDGFALIDTIREDPRLAGVPIMVVTGKDMTPEDWDRLDGNIQTLLSKGRLTPEKMAEKLIRLGLRPAPAGDGGEGSVAGPWAE